MFGDAQENPNNFDIVPFIDVVEYMGDIGSNGANKVVVEHLDMKDETLQTIIGHFEFCRSYVKGKLQKIDPVFTSEYECRQKQ